MPLAMFRLSLMNIGWTSLILISVSVSCITCFNPHHHFSRQLKPQKSSKTEESKPHSAAHSGESDKLKSRSGGNTKDIKDTKDTKGGNPSSVIQHCFASHCEKEKYTIECIRRPVPASLASEKEKVFLKKEKRSSITLRSFLKLVTRSLLKQIPLRTLVMRRAEGRRKILHRGKIQRMTRVQ